MIAMLSTGKSHLLNGDITIAGEKLQDLYILAKIY
jgi:hypothetical protein